MKDIFAGLYNKIIGFFSSTEKVSDESKNVARNRLKLVLMQDRTNLNPALLERMRGELIDLLSKYVEMDKEALDLNFENDGESIALMLSIPVIRAKEEEEIEAALKAEDDAKKELEEKLKALAGQAYLNIARRILGEEVPFLDIDTPQDFMSKIKQFFMDLFGKLSK